MQRDPSGWVRKRIASPPARPAVQPVRREEAAGDHKTFVFQGAEFEGTLRLRESFRIDSEFRGEIVSEGTVTVGEAAGVEASICAREVIIRGAVAGDIRAWRRLVIHSGGRLHGDVETPCLEVERGALFNGRMTMVRPEVVARVSREMRSAAVPPGGLATPGRRTGALPDARDDGPVT